MGLLGLKGRELVFNQDQTGYLGGPSGLWYALRVRSRCEKVVRDVLRCKGYEEFLPLYRKRSQWTDRVREVEFPLFPGYVFSRFDLNDRVPVLRVPGVAHIVGHGPVPVPVEEQQLEAVKRFVASGLPVVPWPFLTVGQTVVVERGSLAGLEGILISVKGPFRLVVSLSLLQRSVAVEIDRDWVRPTTSLPHRIPPVIAMRAGGAYSVAHG